MRKYFWSGAVVALVLATGIYSAAHYARRHPTSLMAQVATVVYKVGFEYGSAARVGHSCTDTAALCQPGVMPCCGHEEAALPPCTTPVEEKAQSRFLDVFTGLPLDASGPCGQMVETEECCPDKVIAIAAGPGCKRDSMATKRSAMKILESAGEEEQESGLLGSQSNKPSAEAVNKRLQSLLQNYQSPETHPVQRKVDTMEFRPSDAHKGEFDRIPF